MRKLRSPDPLPEAVRSLVRAEQAEAEAPPDALARVLERLHEDLAAPIAAPRPMGAASHGRGNVGRGLLSAARTGLRGLPYLTIGFGLGVAAAPSVRSHLARLVPSQHEVATPSTAPPAETTRELRGPEPTAAPEVPVGSS